MATPTSFSGRLGSTAVPNPKTSKGPAKKKPLPLKQRTSSVDPRRDYSSQTWTSLLGLVKMREFLVTVDHFSIWRRHLAWAIEDGAQLREHMTKRYASSMVFMSLLLSTELGVLFNSSTVTSDMRAALREQQFGTVYFYVGCSIMLSVIFSVFSLISIFTAWSLVSAVNDSNAHCIFRSSIGQYAAELPGRFIVSSIYAFLLWVIMFFFVLTGGGIFSIVILCFTIGLFVHTITAFSSFGRVIMHTGAMGSQPIFDPEFETNLSPHLLHHNLLIKARANLNTNTSIRRQYRTKIEPIRYSISEDQLTMQLSDRSSFSIDTPTSQDMAARDSSFARSAPPPPPPQRQANSENSRPLSSVQAGNSVSPKRTATSSTVSSFSPASSPVTNRHSRSNSLVKFSDGFDTTGNRFPDTAEDDEKALGQSRSKTKSSRPSAVTTRNISTGRADAQSSVTSSSRPHALATRSTSTDQREEGNPGHSSARPSPVQIRTVSGTGSNHAPTSAQSSAPQWIQPYPGPGGFINGHPYQQPIAQQPVPYQVPSMNLNTNLMQNWLLENPPQDAASQTGSLPVDARQTGHPLRGMQPDYASHHHHYHMNAGPVVGEQRRSNFSEADAFSYLEQSVCGSEMGDEEFDALLDPEPSPNKGVQGQGKFDKHSASSLAGLSIESDEEDQYMKFAESGALLQRAEQGNNYQSLDNGQPIEVASTPRE